MLIGCLSVPAPQAASSLPYWQQADAELDTPAAKAMRLELRHHPLVTSVLEVWWETAQRSMITEETEEIEYLHHDKYVLMSCKVRVPPSDYGLLCALAAPIATRTAANETTLASAVASGLTRSLWPDP